jgi:hypothetical protein
MRYPHRFAVPALVLLLASALLAQKPLNTRYVLVSVTDATGAVVQGLGPSDFVVEENGVARETLDVRHANYPIAILIDTSNTARNGFIKMREAVANFSERLKDRQISLTTFGDVPTTVVSFSDEHPDVPAAANTLFARPDMESHVLDGIIDVAKDLQKRSSPLSMIVVVSAGGFDQSRRSMGEVFRPVLASHSMVHVIEARSPHAGGYLRRPRLRLDTSAAAADASQQLQQALEGLAVRTRGSYRQVMGGTGTGFDGMLRGLASRISAEVVLEYIVPDDAPPSKDLKIGVAMAGATVWGLGLESPPVDPAGPPSR